MKCHVFLLLSFQFLKSNLRFCVSTNSSCCSQHFATLFLDFSSGVCQFSWRHVWMMSRSFSHSHGRPGSNESTLKSCLLMIFCIYVFTTSSERVFTRTHVTLLRIFTCARFFSTCGTIFSSVVHKSLSLFSTSSLALTVSSVDQWAYTVIPVLWLVSQLSWLHLLPTHRPLWSLIGAAEVLKLPYYKPWILIVLNVLVSNKILEHHDRRTFVDEHEVLIIIYNVKLDSVNTVVVR